MTSVLAKIAFFVLGLVSLLPWNLFINAHEYFMEKFKTQNSTTNSTNSYQEMFENYFSVTGTVTMLIGVLVNVFLTERFTCRVRMWTGHVMILLGLVATASLAKIDTSQSVLAQSQFFYTTLLLMVLSVFGSSIVQGSASGLAAYHASVCMRLFVLAQAVAGVLVSVSDVLALSSSIDTGLASLLYFSFGAVLVIISIMTYISLEKQSCKLSVVLIDSTDSGVWTEQLLSDAEERENHDKSGPKEVGFSGNTSSRDADVHLLPIVWKTLTYGLCVSSVMLVTLTCFPAICSRVLSNSSNSTWQKYFTAVACFLLFNTGDCIGRFCCNICKWPRMGQARLLLFFCFLRIIFIPLFFFCNISRRIHFVSIFTEDYEFIILMLLFAWTNGYLYTHACQYLPGVVEKKEDELAGSLISVYAMVGVCLGPLLSVALTKLFLR